MSIGAEELGGSADDYQDEDIDMEQSVFSSFFFKFCWEIFERHICQK